MSRALDSYGQERKEKTKKNVLYLGIFSIVMMFAGFTSAYIIVYQDNFWVTVSMPTYFWISTAVVVVSSLTMYLARKNIRSNYNASKTYIALTVLFGIAFCVLQTLGWKDLLSRGTYMVMPIVNSEGRYDDPYALFYQDRKIEYKNNEFFYQGEKVSPDMRETMNDLVGEFDEYEQKDIDLSPWYSEGWAVYHNDDLVTNANGNLFINDSSLTEIQKVGIKHFSDFLVKDYGDFIMEGNYGEDFYITYKGQQLEYKNREFLYDGKKLSPALYNKLSDSQNQSAAFLYLFTGLHVLHLFVGMLFLLRLFIITLKKDFTEDIHLKLKLGSIYWHFVGGLWIYLYLFLLLIH